MLSAVRDAVPTLSQSISHGHDPERGWAWGTGWGRALQVNDQKTEPGPNAKSQKVVLEGQYGWLSESQAGEGGRAR